MKDEKARKPINSEQLKLNIENKEIEADYIENLSLVYKELITSL